MTKETAIRLNIEVGEDHTIRLPDEVPVGPAELIVLPRKPASDVPDALGLFKDTPDVIDRAMEHVAEMRSRSRLRPLK